MNRARFVKLASDSGLTERQAEAFYRRHIAGQGRQEAAKAMDTSASNVDNLERVARLKIRDAQRLGSVVRAAGYDDLRDDADDPWLGETPQWRRGRD